MLIRLNDDYVEDVGLGSLSPEAKKHFLQSVYSELEMRVGERLTEDRSDQALDVFGCFIDMDLLKMREWFALCNPDYHQELAFKALKDANPEATEAQLLSEYGAMKWLQFNRPDYADVTREVFGEITEQIKVNPQRILDIYMTEAAQ